MDCDVAIIGGGIGGLATAARLQAAGLSTVVFESHRHVGGCAGYFHRRGFFFDVGATTLVDFGSEGVGGELLESIGMPPINGEELPGYLAWLPDRKVTLYRDRLSWQRERLRAFGDSSRHRQFWRLLDRLSAVFWRAARRGVKLPVQSIADCWRAAACMGLTRLPDARYVNWTMRDALRRFGLSEDAALKGLLAMLIEDTVHSTVGEAPLINASLGISIRGAGLMRADGGMRGFWREFSNHYRSLGGQLRLGCRADQITGGYGAFQIKTSRGEFTSSQVVSAVPASVTAAIGPPNVQAALQRLVERDARAQGGALVVFLGVPEDEVAEQEFTHHQMMSDYSSPLGNGNNMFVSVSARDDLQSAPAGYRAVMISTHCDLADWEGLSSLEYERHKAQMGQRLVRLARRAYPNLARRAVVWEVGTPRTYERFTRRPRGAVGGVRQSLGNSNQAAVPQDIGVDGFWQVGDTTWPGLGTVACVLGSRIAARGALARSARPKTEGGRRASLQRSQQERTAEVEDGKRPRPEVAALPSLGSMGDDLLVTSTYRRRLALARPALVVLAFSLAAYAGLWWLTPLLVFLIFIAIVTAAHDVVHCSLGLTPRQTDWALFYLGAVLLESGHAYRITHLQHHRKFPEREDPEGDPARMSFIGAALHGIVFLPRLWLWAYRQPAARGQRRWLLAEAIWAVSFVIAGIVLLPWSAGVLVYAALAILGSWVYPLLTVHLPHRNYGETPLSQTHTLRGRWIPKLFLELTYHLEHHLYPEVPSHNLAKLSKRLDPYLKRAGVIPRRVP